MIAVTFLGLRRRPSAGWHSTCLRSGARPRQRQRRAAAWPPPHDLCHSLANKHESQPSAATCLDYRLPQRQAPLDWRFPFAAHNFLVTSQSPCGRPRAAPATVDKAFGKRDSVRLDRVGKLTAIAATAAICVGVVTACGSGGINGGSSTAIAGAAAGQAACAGRNELKAEGSTAQEEAVALFNKAWATLCPGKKVSYSATGSGAGREQFIAGDVDFAGSDSPLVAAQISPAAKRCDGNAAWDLPMVFGPIALVYNLTDVGSLVVNADTLAKIFSGAIQTWDDPILRSLNPDVSLPDTRITPIHRTDSSGTNDNFQRYLTAAAPQSWTKGVGGEFHGNVGEGAPLSTGVIEAVRSTPGAIGYVAKGFADRAGVPYSRINTGAGVVALTEETARNAVEDATFAANGNDLVLELDRVYGIHEPDVYPLVLASYEIVCSKGYDRDTAAAIKAFLITAANEGQNGLSAAGYVPVPNKVKERLVTAIDAME